jgi:hypothetical protein
MATVSVSQIAATLQVIDRIEKLELDPTVQKKYGDMLKKAQEKVHALHENVTTVEDWNKLNDTVKALAAEIVKAQAEAKKHQGPAFKWKGQDHASESEAVTFIKRYLPSSGHGNVSQAMNDLTLGRGKSTSGASGVLHASAGPEQKGKGCTLFFKRDGDTIEIVAIGQHDEVKSGQKPKYSIHWSGSSTFKKDSVYEF